MIKNSLFSATFWTVCMARCVTCLLSGSSQLCVSGQAEELVHHREATLDMAALWNWFCTAHTVLNNTEFGINAIRNNRPNV